MPWSPFFAYCCHRTDCCGAASTGRLHLSAQGISSGDGGRRGCGRRIHLCMPVTCKRTVTEELSDGSEAETEITFKRFVFRRNWFMLH